MGRYAVRVTRRDATVEGCIFAALLLGLGVGTVDHWAHGVYGMGPLCFGLALFVPGMGRHCFKLGLLGVMLLGGPPASAALTDYADANSRIGTGPPVTAPAFPELQTAPAP